MSQISLLKAVRYPYSFSTVLSLCSSFLFTLPFGLFLMIFLFLISCMPTCFSLSALIASEDATLWLKGCAASARGSPTSLSGQLVLTCLSYCGFKDVLLAQTCYKMIFNHYCSSTHLFFSYGYV